MRPRYGGGLGLDEISETLTVEKGVFLPGSHVHQAIQNGENRVESAGFRVIRPPGFPLRLRRDCLDDPVGSTNTHSAFG